MKIFTGVTLKYLPDLHTNQIRFMMRGPSGVQFLFTQYEVIVNKSVVLSNTVKNPFLWVRWQSYACLDQSVKKRVKLSSSEEH